MIPPTLITLSGEGADATGRTSSLLDTGEVSPISGLESFTISSQPTGVELTELRNALVLDENETEFNLAQAVVDQDPTREPDVVSERYDILVSKVSATESKMSAPTTSQKEIGAQTNISRELVYSPSSSASFSVEGGGNPVQNLVEMASAGISKSSLPADAGRQNELTMHNEHGARNGLLGVATNAATSSQSLDPRPLVEGQDEAPMIAGIRKNLDTLSSEIGADHFFGGRITDNSAPHKKIAASHGWTVQNMLANPNAPTISQFSEGSQWSAIRTSETDRRDGAGRDPYPLAVNNGSFQTAGRFSPNTGNLLGPTTAMVKNSQTRHVSAVEADTDVFFSASETASRVESTESGSSSSFSKNQFPAIRHDAFRGIAAQIFQEVKPNAPGTFEITLRPEELGKLKMTLTMHENGVSVGFVVERSETLDMIRRHAASLAKEFSAQGFDSVNLSFDHADGNGARSEYSEHRERNDGNDAKDLFGTDGEPVDASRSLGLDRNKSLDKRI